MISLTVRNVNELFPVGMMFLRIDGKPRDSRNGPVIEMPDPVSVKYLCPRERVLFNRDRAINPYLHFFEPLWILAGRDDVAFLSNIVSRFMGYSDDGKTFHGAYGRRLREDGYDQVAKAIQLLKNDPDDRRVVLQIRHPNDMWYVGKDSPCNTAVACKIRDGVLNIHVFNRSNDFIWGLAGANATQFSMLQEYMAAHIGVNVGVYHQTTDSMHVYTENPQWEVLKMTSLVQLDPYEQDVRPYPLRSMGETMEQWDEDLFHFFYSVDNGKPVVGDQYETKYFKSVVTPMWQSLNAYKAKNKAEAVLRAAEVAADDWRQYTIQWLGDRNV